MKSLYLLLMVTIISFTSCRTKEGAPGPAGATNLNKQGSISGSLAYLNSDGDSINIPFNYEYFESLNLNTFSYNAEDEYYFADFWRRGISDENNYIEFASFDGAEINGTFSAPENFYFGFSTVKNINNELFEFSSGFSVGDSDSECIISNFSLDTLSGRLIFDFKSVYDPNNINYSSKKDYTTPAVVQGHVDVSLYRKKYVYFD